MSSGNSADRHSVQARLREPIATAEQTALFVRQHHAAGLARTA